jgi:hypothetical protein
VYVVEMTTDAQLQELLILQAPEYALRLRRCNLNNGLPLTARWITEQILQQEK